MPAVLIGSRALKYWYPNYPRYRNSDYDIILSNDHESFDELQKIPRNAHGKVIYNQAEIEFDDKESNKLILSESSANPTISINICDLHIECNVASPQVLLAIKKSHRYFQDNWHKNIKDYLFLESMTSLNETHQRICDIRLLEKRGRVGRSLNVPNEEFFEGSQHIVNRIFVHDDIHYATCFYDKPIWTRCKANQDLAKVDKHLFDNLEYIDKVRMAQEEAFVIALERIIIPKIKCFKTCRINNNIARKAYDWAVMRLGTTLTSGWFRDFVIDNYIDIMKVNKDTSYITKFLLGVESGKIRKNQS